MGAFVRCVLLSGLVMAGLMGSVESASAVTPRSVTMAMPSTVTLGATVSFSGSVSKSPSGSTVRIQRRSGTSWVTAQTIRTRSGGRYSGRFVARSASTLTYRAYAPRTSKLAAAVSRPRTLQVLRSFTSAPKPSIDGTPEVGRTLTVIPGAWSPTPAFTYRWRRDGTPVAGPTSSTYALSDADLGAAISVEV